MSSSSDTQARAMSDAIAGTLAALLSLWSFYPMDVYKTLVQSNRSVSTAIQVGSLGAGISWKSAHTAASNFVYFYLYSWIQRNVRNRHDSPSVFKRLLMAALAAMGNTFLTLPLDVISTRKQQQQQQQQRLENDSHANHEIRKPAQETNQQQQQDNQQQLDKLTHYWKGLLPSLLLCTNPSIHYTVFDTLRQRLLRHRQHLHWMEAFWLGAVAKFIATLTTYPLIRAKMLLMTQSTPMRSLWTTLQQEYKERGCSGLYQGCRLQLIHTLLKSALLMMIRERLTEITHRLRNTHRPLHETS